MLDPEELDVEDFEQITELSDPLLVLCMATYGEGDPTDNALQFYEYLSEANINLDGLRYAVSFSSFIIFFSTTLLKQSGRHFFVNQLLNLFF